MSRLRLGYLNFLEDNHISRKTNNESFLNLISDFIDVRNIKFSKKKDFKNLFKNISKYSLDYLFIDGFNFLVSSFILREKFKIDLPFIIKLDTVFLWILKYLFIIPLIKEYDVIVSPSEYAKRNFFL